MSEREGRTDRRTDGRTDGRTENSFTEYAALHYVAPKTTTRVSV